MLNIDLASTISQLAGVKPTLPQDGHSFVPFLHHEQVPWRHAFLVEYLGHDLLKHGGPPPYEAVQTRRNLYVEYQNGWRELYNLRRDPWELNNLSGDPATDLQQDKLGVILRRLYTAPPTLPPAELRLRRRRARASSTSSCTPDRRRGTAGSGTAPRRSRCR